MIKKINNIYILHAIFNCNSILVILQNYNIIFVLKKSTYYERVSEQYPFVILQMLLCSTKK